MDTLTYRPGQTAGSGHRTNSQFPVHPDSILCPCPMSHNNRKLYCLLFFFLICKSLKNILHHFCCIQILAAASVSTGCLSFGLCMAYTSSAIPSIMEAHSPLNISTSQASWMSEQISHHHFHQVLTLIDIIYLSFLSSNCVFYATLCLMHWPSCKVSFSNIFSLLHFLLSFII